MAVSYAAHVRPPPKGHWGVSSPWEAVIQPGNSRSAEGSIKTASKQLGKRPGKGGFALTAQLKLLCQVVYLWLGAVACWRLLGAS